MIRKNKRALKYRRRMGIRHFRSLNADNNHSRGRLIDSKYNLMTYTRDSLSIDVEDIEQYLNIDTRIILQKKKLIKDKHNLMKVSKDKDDSKKSEEGKDDATVKETHYFR